MPSQPAHPDGAGLPEVVVDPVGGEQPAERHLHPVADLHVVGVDVGELDREAAAAVEVDDREDDRRARRVREPVDGERRDRGRDVGHRRGFHVVERTAASRRAGGRCSAPLARSREPTKPNFQSSERPAAARRDARRLGTARRLDRHHAAARTGTCRRAGRRRASSCVATERAGAYARERVGRAEEQHVGAVGEHDQRDDLARRGLLERAAEQQPGCAVPVLPTVAARSSTSARPSRRAAWPSARTARACRPVTMTWSTSVRRSAPRPSAPRSRPARRAARTGLAETLLPELGAAVAGRAPAVEELLGRRAAAEELRDHRRRSARRRRAARPRRRRPRPRRRCSAGRCGCRT